MATGVSGQENHHQTKPAVGKEAHHETEHEQGRMGADRPKLPYPSFQQQSPPLHPQPHWLLLGSKSTEQQKTWTSNPVSDIKKALCISNATISGIGFGCQHSLFLQQTINQSIYKGYHPSIYHSKDFISTIPGF
ncbi:hypothetical protein L3X38_020379 [Prunus dulcis]|uniref:Uncharacterized protein n=1 Tax=Prunus dulcis TaxID=3755 RepID=A0AAD4WCN3_PRUDU|nr:hypothetical protein L3X38_020379 [Prunus dulcis]